MLEIKHISKIFGTHRALDDVSLAIAKGEIVSLLGVNGAGKTTLSSIVASLHPPTSGEVLLDGVSIYNDVIAYRHTIGFCAQVPHLSSRMTVREHLTAAGHLFLMKAEDITQRVDELVTLFGLQAYADKDPSILSGGYRQRLLIARSMVHRPRLIILDEPTVALDPHIRRQIWDIILNLKKNGVSILLTTHYIDEAEVLSDRICVLHAGKVQLIDAPQALMSSYNKERLEDVFLQLIDDQSREQ